MQHKKNEIGHNPITLFTKGFPDVKVYINSVVNDGGELFFMIREGFESFLIIHSAKTDRYTGRKITTGGLKFVKCPLNHDNAEILREQFPFTKPVLVGKRNSYGLGDRLGNAGPAHLQSIGKTEFVPVLAQQSIRELERTGRTAEDVLDAASWSVFREGYRDGFGADGDHLKTTNDIDLMVKAGFTMFTIDPSEYVANEALGMSEEDLHGNFEKLPWDLLDEHSNEFLDRMVGASFVLEDGFELIPSKREILAGMVKYGRVISHTKKLADYLRDTHSGHPAELELSVDETDQPTTLFEHLLIASELKRLGVELVSLAPRFCGDFEKGIDFKGDLEEFKKEYRQHLAIAEKFGGYKLSIHSGSDKFSVYEAIGSLNAGAVHVKTAGTSYLEALRTVAEANPTLFRQILRFSITRFDEDKKSYHISGRPENIPDLKSLKNTELKNLLDHDDTRQVLHVSYGSVLHGQGEVSVAFKKQLMETLTKNEALYESNLLRHFERHLAPFDS